MSSPEFRCVECGEYHKGQCDTGDQLAFALDCYLDDFDDIFGYPPEPGSRRWLIDKGEYPCDAYPTGVAP